MPPTLTRAFDGCTGGSCTAEYHGGGCSGGCTGGRTGSFNGHSTGSSTGNFPDDSADSSTGESVAGDCKTCSALIFLSSLYFRPNPNRNDMMCAENNNNNKNHRIKGVDSRLIFAEVDDVIVLLT